MSFYVLSLCILSFGILSFHSLFCYSVFLNSTYRHSIIQHFIILSFSILSFGILYSFIQHPVILSFSIQHSFITSFSNLSFGILSFVANTHSSRLPQSSFSQVIKLKDMAQEREREREREEDKSFRLWKFQAVASVGLGKGCEIVQHFWREACEYLFRELAAVDSRRHWGQSCKHFSIIKYNSTMSHMD